MFKSATITQKNKFTTTAFLNDHKFKNKFWQFSVEAYVFYKNSTKEINKIIFNILKQRIVSFYKI